MGFDKEQVRTANPLDRVYEELTGASLRGGGTERAGHCPFHDDKTPSLSINVEKQLFNCSAAACGAAGDVFDFVQRQRGCQFIEALEWLATRAGMSRAGDFTPVTRYDYRDEQGVLLSYVQRTAKKEFPQYAPDGTPGITGIRRVLYRLPELRSARAAVVFIPEGEKDVETMRCHNLVATTNPCGAGKWKPGYNADLRGRRVVILPDNDEPGRAHARHIASELHDLATSVKVVELPGLPPKGDVTDWFEAGNTVEALLRLVQGAPEWDPATASSIPLPIEHRANRESRGFSLTSVNELLKEPEDRMPWLVESLLPMGGLSMMAAKPKVGKSTLARNLAVCVARGEPFLGRATSPGAVLYLALEEKRGQVRDHFQRMGVTDEPIHIHVGAAPENAVVELEALIATYHPALVVVDPLSRVIRIKDWKDYGSATRAMEPWVDISRRTGCHVMCVHHMNKTMREVTDLDTLNGSVGFAGAIDAGLLLTRFETDRAIASFNRYGTDLPPTRLVMNPDSGVITAAGPAAVDPVSRHTNNILNLLTNGRAWTEEEIKTAVGGNQTSTAVAIRRLRDDGRVEVQGRGVKNDGFRYSLPQA